MKHFFKPTKGGAMRNQPSGAASSPTPQPEGVGGKGKSRPYGMIDPTTPAPTPPAVHTSVQRQPPVPPTNVVGVQGNPFLQPQQQRRREQ